RATSPAASTTTSRSMNRASPSRCVRSHQKLIRSTSTNRRINKGDHVPRDRPSLFVRLNLVARYGASFAFSLDRAPLARVEDACAARHCLVPCRMAHPCESPTAAVMKRKPTAPKRVRARRTAATEPLAMKPTPTEAHGAPARVTPESATTLRTVVATVRRVMRSDTAAVASFVRAEQKLSWKATSGFRTRTEVDEQEFVMPLGGLMAARAAGTDELLVLEGIGERAELPAAEFPLHSAEGVRDVAIAPLRVRGETLGLLVIGFRTTHHFSDEEQQTLAGLAEMAALALDNARLLETISAAKKIWEQTVDAIPDGIIVHDAAMRITRCNAAAADALGFDTPAASIGMSCAEAFARLFGERAAAYHLSHTTGAATSFEIQAEDRRRYLVAVSPLEMDVGHW